MTEKISKNFTSYLLRKEIICDEKVEIVNYLFQIYIEKMVVYMTLFFYGVYREKIVELFFFLIMYTNLRKYTGGFHAQNFFRCYIGSVTVVVIGLEVFVSMTYTQNLFVSVIYIIAVFTTKSCASDCIWGYGSQASDPKPYSEDSSGYVIYQYNY